MSKYAVLMPNWIGDFLLALSVVERKRCYERDAVLIVSEPLLPLLKVLSDIPAIVINKKSPLGFLRSATMVKKENFKKIYILPHSFSSALFSFLCSIEIRRGVNREQRHILLNDILPRSTRTSKFHITLEYSRVLQTDFIEPARWPACTIEGDKRGFNKVIFCPGAAYGPTKRWQGFRDLARLMANEHIVCLGSDAERFAAEDIVAEAPSRIINLAGRTTIEEASKIIAAAKLVISNDSGLMHLAGYIGTPVVGIFGSTLPSWTHPLGPNSTVCYKPAKCSPCFKKRCRFGNYQCLRNITPHDVAEVATQLLDTSRKHGICC